MKLPSGGMKETIFSALRRGSKRHSVGGWEGMGVHIHTHTQTYTYIVQLHVVYGVHVYVQYDMYVHMHT